MDFLSFNVVLELGSQHTTYTHMSIYICMQTPSDSRQMLKVLGLGNGICGPKGFPLPLLLLPLPLPQAWIWFEFPRNFARVL